MMNLKTIKKVDLAMIRFEKDFQPAMIKPKKTKDKCGIVNKNANINISLKPLQK